jgi:rod shape determining protein RodA
MKRSITVFDGTLLVLLLIIAAISLMTMYSAGMDAPGRFSSHLRNFAIAFGVMWIFACVPPAVLMRFAVPIYAVGIALLIAVAMFGIVKKGARRWIDLGIVIQPSELLKIGVPLMLAWYFDRQETVTRWTKFVVAGILVAIPFALIARQPDLGTAVLVGAGGFYLIFLAGLSWKVLISLAVGGLASLPVIWSVLHDYQRMRVMTLIDPTTDPLGKGFHILQSMIAIGSGGLTGKGWTQGTQTHLEFIPERTSDFLFAAYSEEFGLVGNIVLLVLYFLVIGRGLLIAANAPTLFSRLLAGTLTLMFFTYAFVNMGMVSGILPVVGVPLPFMSYGGTAFVTLGIGMGILMSIHRNRKLMQS